MNNKIFRIKVNKGLAIILSILVAFLMVPTQSIAEDIPEHDGYIVVLADNSNADFDESEFKEIVKDEIYQADSISEIRSEIPACDIEYIEPNYTRTLCDVYEPNDEKYPNSRWEKDIMNVQKAWSRGFFGNYPNSADAPVVAVIDSGIAGTGSSPSMPQHEDLDYSRILPGRSAVSSEKDTDDGYMHGTFVSGIIAAQINNMVGIAGNMPNVKLRPYRCFNSHGGGGIAEEVQCIYAAIEDGVDVINISAGGYIGSKSEEEAIEAACKKGIIICASAGNGSGSAYNYPASYDGVVSVGSLDKNERKSSFSQYNNRVDIIAPGEEVMSLSHNKADGYEISDGTSFSCPQITALAAMCKSIDPSIDHDKFMKLIKETSRDAGSSSYDTSYGWGIADFGNMLDALVPEEDSIWEADVTDISAEPAYTGSAITFNDLKLTMPDGRELSAGADYSVKYYNNTNNGTALLTIEGKGDYTGRINKYFQIGGGNPQTIIPSYSGEIEDIGGGGGLPQPEEEASAEATSDASADPQPTPIVKVAKTSIKKLIAGKKSFTITWKKVKNADGYRLQYSTTKTFKKGTRKTLTISKKRTAYTVKKLKVHKKYYVRMRCYKVIDGKKYYGSWSKYKTIKTK